MKSTLLTLLAAMMIPAVSSAKVEDFNAMISENAQAQSLLQKDLRQQMGSTRQAQAKAPKKERLEIAQDFNDSVVSPTKKSFLTFAKETTHYRASEAKQQQRIAQELRDADMAF